jgi:acetyl esterase/lipase
LFAILTVFASTWFLLEGQGSIQPNPPQDSETLWPAGAPDAKGKEPADIPKVTVHRPTEAQAKANKGAGAAIVICPGGGYGFLAKTYEGHDVARWLNSLGVTGIVLEYRLGPKYHYPVQLHDAQRSLRFARAHAEKWNIDPARIGIMGFSAGGHLASMAGTRFDAGDAEATDPIDRLSCRPDFMILCYPVIRMAGPFAHGGSRDNLLGKGADAKLAESLSNDTQVTEKTPPAFLLHTSEDTVVPPENSVLFYQALIRHKVAAELHIYEKGRHGLGLGPAGLPYSSWREQCALWMKSGGLLGSD